MIEKHCLKNFRQTITIPLCSSSLSFSIMTIFYFSETLLGIKEILELIALQTTWKISPINLFVRKFITVSFCFNLFSKKQSLLLKDQQQYFRIRISLLYAAVSNYSLFHMIYPNIVVDIDGYVKYRYILSSLDVKEA